MNLGDRVRLIRPERVLGVPAGAMGTVSDEPYLAHSGMAAVVRFDQGGEYPCYHFEVEVVPPPPPPPPPPRSRFEIMEDL